MTAACVVGVSIRPLASHVVLPQVTWFCLRSREWMVCVGVFVAIDLINNLLQVKMRKRFSVDKSLCHDWLQVLLLLLLLYAHAHSSPRPLPTQTPPRV